MFQFNMHDLNYIIIYIIYYMIYIYILLICSRVVTNRIFSLRKRPVSIHQSATCSDLLSNIKCHDITRLKKNLNLRRKTGNNVKMTHINLAGQVQSKKSTCRKIQKNSVEVNMNGLYRISICRVADLGAVDPDPTFVKILIRTLNFTIFFQYKIN